MRKQVNKMLLMSALLIAAASVPATAQSITLANLPESDGILVINARRLMNDVLPRIIPEAEFAKMKAGLDHLKQFGIDVSKLDSAVIGVRLKGLTTGGGPELMFVVRGSFDADALLALGRQALAGKFRDEKHGAKTVSVLKVSDLAPPGSKPGSNPLPFGINEIAVTALNSSTIVAGSAAYVKDAIDADAGTKRINSELAAIASRDSAALATLAVVLPKGLIAGFIPKEASGNEEIMKILSGIDQILVNVGTDADNFTLTGMIRTETDEHAKTASGLLEFLIRAVSANMKDPAIKSLIDSVKISAQGREVQLRGLVPQSTVAALLRNVMKPAQVEIQTPKEKKPEPSSTKKP